MLYVSHYDDSILKAQSDEFPESKWQQTSALVR
jgi:hypothetical protein